MTNDTQNPRYVVSHSEAYRAWVVDDTIAGYVFRQCGDNREHAEEIAAAQNERWNKMISATEHRTGTSTRKLGGSPIRGGGTYRCSEAHCSCGWSSTDNGQTYAESMQEIREHLKAMDVYTTPLEQTVFAYVRKDARTVTEIAEGSGKTRGRVEKVLAKLVERGNVEQVSPGYYVRTDKWFSWND